MTAVYDGTDLTFGVGDILDIHPGVSGKAAFRMRVQRREEDAAANVVAVGAQFNAAGGEGRIRRVTLIHAGQYDVVATPRTETDGHLDADTIRWLGGTTYRGKWYTARDWYVPGGMLSRPGVYLVGVLTPSPNCWPDAIRAALGPAHRNEKQALVTARAADAPEVWLLTSDGATRVKPPPAGG